MRCCCVRVVIFLLLGVLTTVAVAWAIAYSPWPRLDRTPTRQSDVVDVAAETRLVTLVLNKPGFTLVQVVRQ